MERILSREYCYLYVSALSQWGSGETSVSVSSANLNAVNRKQSGHQSSSAGRATSHSAGPTTGSAQTAAALAGSNTPRRFMSSLTAPYMARLSTSRSQDDTQHSADCSVHSCTNPLTASADQLVAAYPARKMAKPALNTAKGLDSNTLRVAQPKLDFDTGSSRGSRRMRYGPSAKKPSAKDAARGGTVGRRGWSLAPGSSSAAYTAGTTPRELNRASNSGLLAPLNGAPIRSVMSCVSNSVVPCGATKTAALPSASQPATRARRLGSFRGSKSSPEEDATARQGWSDAARRRVPEEEEEEGATNATAVNIP
mmetsp:Transcript_24092/g.59088  ORF Transcript_24092/g.59088 Transcript_24092/m.59088 type:complete len:311 (+) Transcript_24092:147-1079(+)